MQDISRLDFAGPVNATLKFLDTRLIDIEASDARSGASERNGDRQSYIAETDNGNFAVMGQSFTP